MPRPYTTTRRRRRSRRQPWYNRRYSPMELATKAWRATKYIKGLVNSEMYHLQTSGTSSVNNTGTIIHLSALAQGDGPDARTGNSILLRNIFLRLGITQHASATSTYYRIILFHDKQQVSDTPPTVSQLLESSSTLSPLEQDSFGRFKIIQNWFFTTDNTKATTRVIEKYYKVYKHLRYNGTAATDIQKNGLYLMLLSDQPTNTPTIVTGKQIGRAHV